ncbi:MAG: glycosyltransferase family 39 protein [Clostridiales bacterium]|nr:glycosyltransferase family 39 protein [Clostridiales bacterium]
MHRKQTYDILLKIFLSLMIIITFILIGNCKEGFHVDEMYTFGLANHHYNGKGIGPVIHENIVYTGRQLWQEYITASNKHLFDYSNVLANQTADVHPPLYYALIHTICSFFPDTFGMWMGLCVNIALAVIVYWEIVWLFYHLTNRKRLSILFSMLFLFTMGFVNSVVFFRMYVLLTVWTNALVILFCRYRPEENHWKYFTELVVIMVGGMMTQYYFIIFAFLSCVVYAACVISKKNWRKLAGSVISVAGSVGISSLIFPAMYKHIFSGNRGRDAFQSLSEGGLWSGLWDYLNIVNLRVFGNLFLFLLFLILLLYMIRGLNSTVFHLDEKMRCYLQILMPVMGYFVIVAKISPYHTDRYVMNLMGLLYVSVFTILILFAGRFSERSWIGVLMSALLVLFCSYRNGVPYLYSLESDNVAAIEAHQDTTCLYLYDNTWKILPNYLEMTALNEIIFISQEHLDTIEEAEFQDYDSLLVYVISTIDTDQVIGQLIENNPGLDGSKKLFSNGYATAYYLE